LTVYNFKQEYSEYFDFVGNGYGCETRKINVTFANEKICEIYYNEDFCLMLTEQQEFKIVRHHKLFGFSKIEIINQETDEILGNIKLPNWNQDDFKKIGVLNYQGKEYTSRRLRPQKDKKTENRNGWDYFVELSGLDTKIIYKLFQEIKPFISSNHRKQPFHGEVELEKGDLITLIFGIYLVQILLNNEDVVDI
jgi:hypothetical protein